MARPDPSRNSYLFCLTNRDFLLFYIGQYISFIGDRIAQVAFIAILMGTIAAGEAAAGSSRQVTAMMIVSMLPYLVMFPISGWLIDRYRRRNVMIVCTCLQGVVTIATAEVIRAQGFHGVAHAVIYASVLLIYTNSAVFNPAKYALIPEIVPREHLLAANALNTSTATISTLIGTFLGGVLLIPALHALTGNETSGIVWSLYIDCLTFFVPGLMLCFIRGDERAEAHRASEGASVWQRLSEGFRYIRNHGAVWRLMSVVACVWVLAGFFYGALNHLTIETMEAGIQAYSLVTGTMGLGMFTGAILVGLTCRRVRPRKVIAAALLLTGLLLLATRLTMAMPKMRVLSLFFTAGAAGAVIVNLDTLYQRIVADFVRGRIFSISFLVTTSALILGMGLQLGLDSWGIADWLVAHSQGLLAAESVYFQLMSLLALGGFWAVHRTRWGPISGRGG